MALTITRKVGMIVLAIYLILISFGPILGLAVHPLVLAITALVAGILILLDR